MGGGGAWGCLGAVARTPLLAWPRHGSAAWALPADPSPGQAAEVGGSGVSPSRSLCTPFALHPFPSSCTPFALLLPFSTPLKLQPPFLPLLALPLPPRPQATALCPLSLLAPPVCSTLHLPSLIPLHPPHHQAPDSPPFAKAGAHRALASPHWSGTPRRDHLHGTARCRQARGEVRRGCAGDGGAGTCICEQVSEVSPFLCACGSAELAAPPFFPGTLAAGALRRAEAACALPALQGCLRVQGCNPFTPSGSRCVWWLAWPIWVLFGDAF